MSDDAPPPPDDSKLTRSKRAWAREGRFLRARAVRSQSERLPPGQHLVTTWPVLDLGLTPGVPTERWRLDVKGAVERPQSWDFAAFRAQKQTAETTDIHCVTTWSRYDNRWEGLATRDLLEIVRPREDAAFVQLSSYDGYTTNLRLEDFAAADAIIAHSWEGAPLTREHGGPIRLVVPQLYFWKSAKWLREILFTAGDKPGFWEERGYHNRGDPFREERYAD